MTVLPRGIAKYLYLPCIVSIEPNHRFVSDLQNLILSNLIG